MTVLDVNDENVVFEIDAPEWIGVYKKKPLKAGTHTGASTLTVGIFLAIKMPSQAGQGPGRAEFEGRAFTADSNLGGHFVNMRIQSPYRGSD